LDDPAALMAQLKEYVGRPTAAPFTARDDVNQAMIRHWCDAVGDTLPVYTDPDAAAASIHGGIVAPPTMLQAWTMQGLGQPPPQPAPGERGQNDLLRLLDAHGFSSVVATNCDQEYARYLRPGDRLTGEAVIEAISEEKQTGLGAGHFVTTRTTYRDQHGEVVGTMTFRILKFKPRPAAAARPPRPVPAMNQDTRFFWDGAREGELRIQRCTACGALRHPPRPMCPECRSLEWDFAVASGRGTVYSFVVPHHPPLPAFGDGPYVVAVIELPEGTRLVSNVVDCDPADVHVGLAVEVTFADQGEVVLPLFRPVTA